MPAPLLKVDQLRVAFKAGRRIIPAVNGISFAVQRGECLGIVGESGSGKSVTALSVLRLLSVPPAGGKIIFSPKQDTVIDLLQCSSSTLRSIRGGQISMIFQEPMSSLNPVYTCGDQVMEMLRVHQRLSRDAAREKAIALFEQVRLPDPGKMMLRYPHELSGGQQQRVMIAMAISCNPALLIADEPTTALDVTVQKAILELLLAIQRETDMSIIFITHDLATVAEIASRVLVMYRGQIVEQGATTTIFRQPAHPYTKGLLACRQALHQHLSRLPVISDFMPMMPGEETRTIMPAKTSPAGISDTALLEVKDITVRFPVVRYGFSRPSSSVTILENISFTVRTGETLGLVGESGSGKTTLGRTVLGLVKPTAGQISYAGRSVTGLAVPERRALCREMQFIFQDPYSSLNPRLTAGAAITEPMKAHRLYSSEQERKARSIVLLQQVGLSADDYSRYPHEFSGGQRQRINIARALALAPRFLICDEPVAALDVSVQAQVLNLLLELQETMQLTYIFISHDLSVVRFMSDNIMVMQKGRIVESGPADEIYNAPRTAYTQELLAAVPFKAKSW